MSKTDEEIAKDKEAVQKMIGAKTAMEAALRRIELLEATITRMCQATDCVAKCFDPGLMMRAFPIKGAAESVVVPVKDQLLQIASFGRGAL